MNIYEAARIAVAIGWYITRPKKRENIKLTNTKEKCIGIFGIDRIMGVRWQPTEEELMADDWVVTRPKKRENIKLTNTKEKCIGIFGIDRIMGIRWQPTEEELMADDWVVVRRGDTGEETMNICEALKKAVATGKYITRPGMCGKKIKPVDGMNLVFDADGNRLPPAYGWQPSADDLTANDWQIEN